MGKLSHIVMLLLIITQTCFSLPEDQKKILLLRADKVDINQETHQGKYQHHVEFDQGTTHLRAALAMTEINQKNQLIKAIAKGNKEAQAHFWTLIDEKKPPLHAYANKILYFPEKHLIQLIGNAKVEQGKDVFSAPTIHYDTLHKHVISESQGQNQGQTLIIFHPETHHE